MAQSTATYDTQQAFEVRSYDIEYQNAHGESWQARIYQPQGEGPFPAILDVHGGAWNAGNRLNSELMCHSLASSGLVVAAVDFRLGTGAPVSGPGSGRELRYSLAKSPREGVQCRWIHDRGARILQRRAHHDAVGDASKRPPLCGVNLYRR